MHTFPYVYAPQAASRSLSAASSGSTFDKWSALHLRSKQRDPNPKDDSLIRKETSTYKGPHAMFAALLSYQGVVVRVRVPLLATQRLLTISAAPARTQAGQASSASPNAWQKSAYNII